MDDNDIQRKDFERYILDSVNKENTAAYSKTVKAYDKHSADIERVLSTVLPDVINKVTPKPNYWLTMLFSILNGAVLFAAIYSAIVFAFN